MCLSKKAEPSQLYIYINYAKHTIVAYSKNLLMLMSHSLTLERKGIDLSNQVLFQKLQG